MKVGDIFLCNMLPDEELEVVKLYGDSMGTVQSDKTGRKILFSKNKFDYPQLCLAHVSELDKELKIKEEKLW